MKARVLIHEGKLITTLNGEEDFQPQLDKFINDNKNTILVQSVATMV